MPEILPVAIPGGDRLVLVLRVDADEAPHPVMVSATYLRFFAEHVPHGTYRVQSGA